MISCIHYRRNCTQKTENEEISFQGILALVTCDDSPFLYYYPETTLSIERIREQQTIPSDLTVKAKIELDSINYIKIEPTLTVLRRTSCKRAACVCKITIFADEQLEIWFDDVDGILDSQGDVEELFRKWLSIFRLDLVQNEDKYFVTEMKRWPREIPMPQKDSVVGRVGEMGLGFVGAMLGTPAKSKLEDVGFNVLERFAKVTVFAKDKTKQGLEHPLARPILSRIPENVRSQFLSSQESKILLEDYDSAHRYLVQFSNDIQSRMGMTKVNSPNTHVADESHDFSNLQQKYKSHFTGTPLTTEKWHSWFDGDKLTVTPFQIACTIFCGGVEPNLRPVLWPRMLKAMTWSGTDSEFEQKSEQYLQMKASWIEVLGASGNSSPVHIDKPSEGAVGDENENQDVVAKIVERIYRIDKDVVRTDQGVEFYMMRPALDTTKSLKVNIEMNTNLNMLRNVLMTFTVYDFDLGYVQGMNDLCSPILEVVKEESLAFWSFKGFMDRMAPNFSRDQSGMQKQLRMLELMLKVIDPPLYQYFELTDSSNMFCCFRWLLILFKREFPFEELKTLWEVIWMCPLTRNFHLFIAIAVLNNYRQELFECKAFDEILKFINNLSQNINVPEMIKHAEVLYYVFRDRVVQYGPPEICSMIITTLSTNSIENMLCKVSGIEHSDLVLDDVKVKGMEAVSNQEWLELLMVLEITEF